MALVAEREIARADMNDEYGVSVWQHKRLVDYSRDEARQLAHEILAAADAADAVEEQDRTAAFGDHECSPLIVDRATGKTVL